MEMQTLQVEVREGRGKGPARQLRAQGLIPGVFYGQGVETTALSLSPKDLTRVLETKYRLNVVLKINVAGAEQLAMVKDIQVDPVSRRPLHVDLCRVSEDKTVTVHVPLRSEGRSIGVQKGGKLNVVFRTVPVKAPPNKIPDAIVVDVEALDIGDLVKTEDLKLDEDVRVMLSPDRRLVLVTEDRRKAQEAEEAAAAAEGGDAAAAAGA